MTEVGSANVHPGAPAASRGAALAHRWLAATLGLAAVIRFSGLSTQSFWLDEAVTHRIVDGSLAHAISQVAASESTPPLYYVLLWGWSRLFGVHEAGLRSLSALCGVLAVPVAWAIGRRLASERVGLVAALLTAVNPLLVWYSQEARTYALVALLCALTILAFLRALECPSRATLGGWGVVCALALCAHYFALLVVAPEALWLGMTLRAQGQLTGDRAACGLGPVGFAVAVLAPLALHQDDGRASYVAQSGSVPYRLGVLVKQDVFGYIRPGSLALAALALLTTLVVASGWRRCIPAERHASAAMLAIGLGGLALAVLSAVRTDYIDSRNLIVTLPALLLAAAVVLGAARAGRPGALRLVLVVALSAAAILGVITDPHAQRSDWRGAARALGPAGPARAIISLASARRALIPYVRDLQSSPTTLRVGEVDLLSLSPQMLGLTPPALGAPSLAGFRLVARLVTDTYIVLRYRAKAPQNESRTALLDLYPRNLAATVLVQGPATRPR